MLINEGFSMKTKIDNLGTVTSLFLNDCLIVRRRSKCHRLWESPLDLDTLGIAMPLSDCLRFALKPSSSSPESICPLI